MDNPAKDPAGEQKVGPKGNMLSGKKKWYVIGGLGALAVLVFYFVSRSNSAAAGGSTTTTSGTSGLDPATEAALQSALQAQAGSAYGGGGVEGSTGPAGATGPAGPRGKRGKTGKRGPAPKPQHKNPTSYAMVRPGQTLSTIASTHNVKGGWQQLYSMNRSVIGSNPNIIHPGQRLKI
jgi:resuscitation-promoting factor RpfA